MTGLLDRAGALEIARQIADEFVESHKVARIANALLDVQERTRMVDMHWAIGELHASLRALDDLRVAEAGLPILRVMEAVQSTRNNIAAEHNNKAKAAKAARRELESK